MKSYLIHYSEIGLKGRNRSMFEEQLLRNIYRAAKGLGQVTVRRLFGRFRMDIELDEHATTIEQRLGRVFGVAYFAPIEVTKGFDLEPVRAKLLEWAKAGGFESFAVRVRRVNKNFPAKSMDLARDLGTLVGANCDARVDLKNPERTFNVVILNKEIFTYHRRIEGGCGLPVGVSGKVALLLSGGIDSPAAGELLLKRGCALHFIHFHSAPFTDRRSQEKAADLASLLIQHRAEAHLYLVPLGELQRRIVADAPSAYRVMLYRRYMLRIAERLARKSKCLALATGDALGQVASQTLDNITVLDSTIHMPILRPLIAFDKQDIIAIARRIGSFEISIEPDADCCSYLMPKDPVTKARRRDIEEVEKKLSAAGSPIEELVEQIIANTERRTIGPDGVVVSPAAEPE